MIRIGACLALLAGPASAQAIFVDDSATGANNGSSWQDAFVSLHDAFLVASQGDQIWVAEGLYRPSTPGGDRNRSFEIPAGVEVYGGFDATEPSLADRSGLFELTVLSGDLNGDDGPGFTGMGDNSYHVVRTAGVGAASTLDGFLIRAGNADGGAPLQDRGAGLWVTFPLTVANVTLRANRAGGAGGGLYAQQTVTSLDACVFDGNLTLGTGGGLAQESGVLSLNRCSFLANRADRGGGLHTDGSTALAECFLDGNQAAVSGGALEADGAVLEVRRSLFSNNATDLGAAGEGGAVATLDTSGSLRSCLFANNSALVGGGLHAGAGGSPQVLTLDNATVYGNVALGSAGGGGVHSTGGALTVRNSILWENSGTAGVDFAAQIGGSALQADHSCIQKMSSAEAQALGSGNLSQDPLLRAPLGADGVLGTPDDDLRLGKGSPCIDAGENAALPGAEFDFGGLARFVDDPGTVDTGLGAPPVVDLGSHEYHSLFGDAREVSLSQGGVQFLTLEAGADRALDPYIVLGSVSGTTPGFTLLGLTLPLNPDAYFMLLLNDPNNPPLFQSFGTLDPQGTAVATFWIPGAVLDPALAGITVHHAYAVLNPASFQPEQVSNAVPVDLIP